MEEQLTGNIEETSHLEITCGIKAPQCLRMLASVVLRALGQSVTSEYLEGECQSCIKRMYGHFGNPRDNS